MLDPNNKAASAIGFGGTTLSLVLDAFGKFDWAVLAAFLTCVFVALQIIGWFWDRFWTRRKK